MERLQLAQGRPIYKQISEWILQQIQAGALRPGDRLPTERELAERLGVARGTVKKAYKELSDNNIVEVLQGSGTYVHDNRDLFDIERRAQATRMIDAMVEKLEGWNFSLEEISTLLRMALAERDREDRLVRIAIVDCNQDSLTIFKQQLAYLPGVKITAFLIDAVILQPETMEQLLEHDMIITTQTHAEQVQDRIPAKGPLLIRAELAPSRHTIVSISTLPESLRVGIVCSSNKFANLILEQMELFAGERKHIDSNFECDLKSTLRFLKRCDAIILSPDSLLLDRDVAGDALEWFTAHGGRVIRCEYLIERHSLIQIEAQVARTMRDKYGYTPRI